MCWAEKNRLSLLLENAASILLTVCLSHFLTSEKGQENKGRYSCIQGY